MTEVVVIVALDTHQLRSKQCQPERAGTHKRVLRMRQVTAVARQTVRQPEVGTMQNKGQTLGMRHFNALYADKQLIQRR